MAKGQLEVAVFGALRRHLDARNLPHTLEKEIPETGTTAESLAADLQLPKGEIEGVLRNGRVINLYETVYPGDRLAFFPEGTPGPYRVLLGMVRENLRRSRFEEGE